MKKNLIICLFLFGNFEYSYSQSVYLEADSVTETGAASSLISIVNHLINNSLTSVDFRWERIEYNLPSGWDAPFCDKNLCYASSTTTADFTLAPGESGLLKPIFSPNYIEGSGILKVRIYSLSSGVAFEDTATFQAVTDGTIGIDDPVQESSIDVYPTITTGIVYFESSAYHPDFVTITKSDGKLMYTQNSVIWQLNKSEIDISIWDAGIYFITFYSNKNIPLLSKSIIKL